MDRVLLLALALLLAGTSPVAGAQSPSAKAVSPAPPALPTPHVTAIVGELEVDRIIEVHVDQLEDWNLALGGPAATHAGPASLHPAWQLVPYLNGRALSG